MLLNNVLLLYAYFFKDHKSNFEKLGSVICVFLKYYNIYLSFLAINKKLKLQYQKTLY